MKKLKIVAVACCAFALCLVLAGCGASKDSYIGTWDLQYSETIDEEGMPAQIYSEDDVASFAQANLSIYLNLEESDVAILDILGALTNGTWQMDGSNATITFDEPAVVNPETGEATENAVSKLSLSGDTLTMEKDNTRFVFKKGEDKDPYHSEDAVPVADENGMSIIMSDGEPMANPVTIADDDVVFMEIDGIGVDNVGDPGYNLQVQNKTTDTINVWLPNPATVGETEVAVYMYITLNPGQSTTTFLPFDYEQIGGNTVDYLVDVSGEIQVDNASTGDVLGTYTFEFE